MDTLAAWVAAIAAVVAGGLVAWQSWETRKSAQASQAAAAAAQEAVATANETLELSRAQTATASEALKLSRQQAAEAIRTRIDAAMPPITVHADTAPDWPPREPPVGGFGTSNELPYGDNSPVLHMPRDKHSQIEVWLRITIANDSERTVEMTTSGLVANVEGEPVPEPLRLPRGEKEVGWFRVARSLEEWVDILKDRENGDGTSGEAHLNVTYIDPADSGAIDAWTVVLAGTPIERVSSLEGAFRITQDPTGGTGLGGTASVMAGAVMPRERRYWRSRKKNLRLDDDL